MTRVLLAIVAALFAVLAATLIAGVLVGIVRPKITNINPREYEIALPKAYSCSEIRLYYQSGRTDRVPGSGPGRRFVATSPRTPEEIQSDPVVSVEVVGRLFGFSINHIDMQPSGAEPAGTSR